MAKNNKPLVKAGTIIYKMPERMAEAFLETREGNEFKMDVNDFLCKIVNENFNLNGNCIRVIRY